MLSAVVFGEQVGEAGESKSARGSLDNEEAFTANDTKSESGVELTSATTSSHSHDTVLPQGRGAIPKYLLCLRVETLFKGD